ncbi:hypothetical protein K469DRAFT_685828 [Zopfia rhizophila CBS 207.26]|uniref:Uncharacterized protein n=1 Tax=Zopfia rhizophila CBS 207.26 TaxID=1314779 RepID=A0A6A6E9Q6_9PEZI|nr:hypothetical protein K469DRAFT_685828 [Zopfia rhizophila CBS 207.26]
MSRQPTFHLALHPLWLVDCSNEAYDSDPLCPPLCRDITTSTKWKLLVKPLVGRSNLVYYAHEPEYAAFATFANFQPGESTLDFHISSARILIESKRRVGYSICVGVDCVKDLLAVDVKHNVKPAGFDTGKSAPAAFSICLYCGKIAASIACMASWTPLPRVGSISSLASGYSNCCRRYFGLPHCDNWYQCWI